MSKTLRETLSERATERISWLAKRRKKNKNDDLYAEGAIDAYSDMMYYIDKWLIEAQSK